MVRAHETAPTQGATVLAASAYGLTDRIAREGVDPGEVLTAAGLRADALADPTRRVSLSALCQVLEIAAERSNNPNFGLEYGGTFQPQELGLLGYLAISSATLGMALRKIVDYIGAHQQGTHMALTYSSTGHAFLAYAILDKNIRCRRQDAEVSMGMMINLVRHCLGARWLPVAVHLAHPKTHSLSRYEGIFGIAPRFDQSANGIVLRRAELDCPMPRRDDHLVRLLELELHNRLAQLPRTTDIVARARYEIERALGLDAFDLQAIAGRCGLPAWTLKRRLSEHGLTFKALLSETRRDLAIKYLGQGVGLAEVAGALGYSEVSAFSRAFHEWTGLRPGKFPPSR